VTGKADRHLVKFSVHAGFGVGNLAQKIADTIDDLGNFIKAASIFCNDGYGEMGCRSELGEGGGKGCDRQL